MNACERIRELMPWYVNGTLSHEEMRDVTAHLAGCEACSEELALTLRLKVSLDDDLRGLPKLPETVAKKVQAAIGGRSIAQIDVGSFLLGFSFGARVQKSGVPVQGDLKLLGRKIQLFKVGKEE